MNSLLRTHSKSFIILKSFGNFTKIFLEAHPSSSTELQGKWLSLSNCTYSLGSLIDTCYAWQQDPKLFHLYISYSCYEYNLIDFRNIPKRYATYMETFLLMNLVWSYIHKSSHQVRSLLSRGLFFVLTCQWLILGFSFLHPIFINHKVCVGGLAP